MVEAYNDKVKDDFTMARYQAWHTALYSRMKRPPRLSEVFNPQQVHKLEGRELQKAIDEDKRIRARFGCSG